MKAVDAAELKEAIQRCIAAYPKSPRPIVSGVWDEQQASCDVPPIGHLRSSLGERSEEHRKQVCERQLSTAKANRGVSALAPSDSLALRSGFSDGRSMRSFCEHAVARLNLDQKKLNESVAACLTQVSLRKNQSMSFSEYQKMGKPPSVTSSGEVGAQRNPK
jgi:hypothetical protein